MRRDTCIAVFTRTWGRPLKTTIKEETMEVPSRKKRRTMGQRQFLKCPARGYNRKRSSLTFAYRAPPPLMGTSHPVLSPLFTPHISHPFFLHILHRIFTGNFPYSNGQPDNILHYQLPRIRLALLTICDNIAFNVHGEPDTSCKKLCNKLNCCS